jgi:hypothetical protein
LNSGLTIGGNYPIVATVPSASKTATIVDTTALATSTSSIRMALDGTNHSTNLFAFTAPAGEDHGGSSGTYNDATTEMYVFFFASTSDQRVRNTYYSAAAGDAGGKALAGGATATVLAGTNTATDNDYAGASLKLKFTEAAIAEATGDAL